MANKVCVKCGEIKDESDFYKISVSSGKLRSKCKACMYIESSLWKTNNKEKTISLGRASYERNKNLGNNREKHCQRTREYTKTANGKYTEYKSSAKKRGIEFSLSFEEFSLFWDSKCHYCSDKITTIGLDRIDSSIGYLSNNIVPCCYTCNRMKMGLSREDFINHITLLYETFVILNNGKPNVSSNH